MTELPPRILDFLRGPPRSACSVVVRAPPPSDGTLLLIQLARDLRKEAYFGFRGDAYLGLNYVNVRTPWYTLRRRYPFFRRHFNPAGLNADWLQLPRFREVPRTELDILLELISLGRSDGEGISAFDPPHSDERDDRQEFGGTWHPPKRDLPGEHVAEKPPSSMILRDFELLWDYVERSRRVPVLLLIDSVDGLARHYGVEIERLVRALHRDLVDTGHAIVVYAFESRKWASWFRLVDGVLSFSRIRAEGEPRWSLTIDRLPGCGLRRDTFVTSLANGRLVSQPSTSDIVDHLLRDQTPPPSSGLPRDILEAFRHVDRRGWIDDGYRDGGNGPSFRPPG